MRGHVIRSAFTVKAAAFLFVVLFLLAPIGSVSAGSLPVIEPAGTADPALAPTGSATSESAMPLDDVVTSAVAQVRESGGTNVLRPDQFPHYEALEENEKRLLWQVWQITVSHVRITQPGAVLVAEEDTTRSAEATMDTESGAGPSRGLRGVWTLDIHGRPNEVLSAGDGAYFLVTSQGILRFEDPDSRPTWMVKTGSVQHTETTDVNGDGTADIVLTMSPWFVPEGRANLIVVDGKTGDQILEGFAEDDRLSTWRLTDIDGDGTMDLVGLTISGDMVGAKLDGTILWREPLPRLFQGAGYFLVYAFVYYYSYGWLAFADVDADGALDIVTTPIGGAAVFAFLVYEGVQANTHTAWSGADGTQLWTAPLPIVADYGYAFPTRTGDFDGDGRDDIGYSAYSWSSVGAILVYQSIRHHGFFITTGEDGTALADDRHIWTSGFPLFIPVGTGNPPYEAILGFEDLDRDGAKELITLEIDGYWRELKDLQVVGRGPPVAGGPTTELWRQSIDVEKELGAWGLSVRFRDADGDGTVELRTHLAGYATDEKGVIKHTQSTASIVTADDVDAVQTGVFAFDSDLDPANGQAYTWTGDDRWVRLETADGSKGLQLITSGSVRSTHDVTGDGVVDLLVHKTSGLRWLDGTTGRSAIELERPLNRYGHQIVLSEGRPVLIERDWFRSMTWGTDAQNGDPLWVVDAEAMDKQEKGLWPYSYQDFTGDGRIELLARISDHQKDSRSLVLMSLPDQTELWRAVQPEGYLRVMDVLERPGYELLLSAYSRDRDGESYSLFVPGEDGPIWTLETDDDYLLRAGNDRIVLRHYNEKGSLKIVDATTGKVNLTFPIPDDTSVRGVHLLHVDADQTVDLVWELYKYERRGEGESYGLVHSLADGKLITRFETIRNDDYYGPYSYSTPIASDGHEFSIEAYGWFYGGGFRDGVTDWDGDGNNDLLFIEEERAIVRSGGSGEILAVSPGRVRSVFLADLNQDGRSELGTLSALGRLRFHTYSEGLEGPTMPDESLLLVATPDEPVSEDPSFFQEETGLLPGIGAMPLIALLVGLLGVLVRRRR